MAALTWNIQLTGAGAGTSKYIPTVQKEVTLSGGTARSLDSTESGTFEQLVAALERGKRHVARQFKLGNVPDSSSVSLLITLSAPGGPYTPSVKTGASASGTNVALNTTEVGEARPWTEALERAHRHVLNRIAQGD